MSVPDITFFDIVAGAAYSGVRPDLRDITVDNDVFKIFIIDDSDLFQYYLKGYVKNLINRGVSSLTGEGLKKDKYEVYQFYTGKDAIYNLWRQPDLVVLDYHIESDDEKLESNADEIFEAIKKAGLKSKVVMMSHQKTVELENHLTTLGVEHFIEKDVDELHHLDKFIFAYQ